MIDTKLKDAILSSVDQLKEALVQLVVNTVKIPSINPTLPGVDYEENLGRETKVAEYLKPIMEDIGLDVDMWDFSMRLYPHTFSTTFGPCRLGDMSFSHLLQPPVPELYARAVLYCALSLILIALSVPLLKRMRNR